MRVLFISNTGASLGIAQRFINESHDVKFLSESRSGLGLVPSFKSEDLWQPDIVIYDHTLFTAQAESVRSRGIKVVGPTRWSSLMVNDSNYQAQIISSLGWGEPTLTSGTHLYLTAWYNGASYISTYVSILYKRFMSGGAGPDMGCSGMIAQFDVPNKTKQTFLTPLEKILRKVNYRGAITVHAIVNGDQFAVKEIIADHAHPLSYLLLENSTISASEITLRLLDETSKPIENICSWASGLRISSPSSSYELAGIVPAMSKHLWLNEVSFTEGKYITEGLGFAGYVTARGSSEQECVRRMYRTVGNIVAPDLQYRNDIARNLQSLLISLRQPGWLA